MIMWSQYVKDWKTQETSIINSRRLQLSGVGERLKFVLQSSCDSWRQAEEKWFFFLSHKSWLNIQLWNTSDAFLLDSIIEIFCLLNFEEKLKKSIKIVSIPRGLLSNLHSTSKHWRNCGKSINLSIATQKRKTLKRTTNMQEKEVKSYKSVLFRNDFLSSSTTFRRPSSVLFLAYVNLIIECKVESEKLSANYPTHHEIIFAY